MSVNLPSRATSHLQVRMPLTLMIGKRACPTLSEEVWSGGLVVRCDMPVPIRQLVKVQAPVPPDGTPVTLTAMVESARPASPGVAPALTLSLFGNGGTPVERWNALLGEVRTRFPDAASHPVVSEAVTEETPDAVHRRHVRFFATFEVRVSTVDELMTLMTRDISRGGMFLHTRRSLPVGAELQVEIVHPETADVFSLHGTVRRRVTDGELSGLGVEFVDLDADRQRALWAFVASGLPDVDVELVEEP